MRETSKCREIRVNRGDFSNYLRGNGIDIGAGNDPLRVVQGSVRAWDMKDGDAQLMEGISDTIFDFVYSSHCLEHMREVPEALSNWVRILKPNGWLYVVVPDYILDEKMTWPSRFNQDHKQSFSNIVTRNNVRRPNHWHTNEDLIPLLRSLNLVDINWALESHNFNFNAGLFDQTMQNAMAQLYFVARKPAD